MPSISGTIEGRRFASFKAKKTGKGTFEIRVPRGLEDVYVSITTSEHLAYVVEFGDARPGIGECHHLQNLDTIDRDLDQFKITWYPCPHLLVKIRKDGQLLDSKDAEILAQHEGAYGYLTFRRQPDGVHCSSGVIPDRNLRLTVTGAGFEEVIEEIAVDFNEVRELEIEI